MKKYYLLFSVMVVLLVNSNAQATGIHKPALEPKSTLSKIQRLKHLEDMVNIQFDHSPIRFDSVSLDSFIRTYMENAHIPGLATWAIKNGQVIWQQCYGYANLEDSIEVADTTLFTLMSISKTITGTAIMQLWERGEFGLDDDVNNYLPFNVRNPYFPDSVITFRMLMTHTSSINDNWTILNPLWVRGDSPIPLGEFLVNYLVPGGSYYNSANFNYFPPGAAYDYSNVAVGLLGYLVEILEDSFPIHCQDSIFQPLSMDETSWFLANLDTNNIAMGYSWNGTSYDSVGHWGCPFYPAAHLRTSSVQLARYLTAFMQYGIIDTVRILDSTTVVAITTPQYEWATNYWIGLIWHYALLFGRWIWAHNGAGDGIDTFMAFCPTESSAVIALTNCENYGCSWTIAEALFDYAQEYGVAEFEPSKPIFTVLQISPNPFRDRVNIRWQITDNCKDVDLKIYDATGCLVKSFRITPDALRSTLYWDGRDGQNRMLGSGVYFVKLQAGNYKETKKLLLIK
jgi:CubicO group peptidase (beta-lactamase class C family)